MSKKKKQKSPDKSLNEKQKIATVNVIEGRVDFYEYRAKDAAANLNDVITTAVAKGIPAVITSSGTSRRPKVVIKGNGKVACIDGERNVLEIKDAKRRFFSLLNFVASNDQKVIIRLDNDTSALMMRHPAHPPRTLDLFEHAVKRAVK